MIRTELGDELFWQAIHTFVQDHAHQTVETIDLLRAIDKATGRNLRFLFDQYVLRGGHPDYKVAYSWDGDSNWPSSPSPKPRLKTATPAAPAACSTCASPLVLAMFLTASPPKVNVEQPFTVRIHEREQALLLPPEEKARFHQF
jgi:aminopeptidase N